MDQQAHHPTDIIDERMPQEFASITFSKYKKADAKKELVTCILTSKEESACYWSAEFICAGHFNDIWEIIIFFLGKYIHLGNPKLAIYIESRYNVYKSIINGDGHSILDYRNDSRIRRLFAEIVCILCNAPKKNSFEAIKIKPADFNLSEKLRADDVCYAGTVLRNNDSSELFVPLNELGYSIQEQSDCFTAFYWIEWIMEYEAICRKKNEYPLCEVRQGYQVDARYKKDVVWLIWDLLLQKAPRRSELHLKIMTSLKELFCVKYTAAMYKKRRFLLYFAVLLLTENVQMDIPIIQNRTIIQNAIDKIDEIYSEFAG